MVGEINFRDVKKSFVRPDGETVHALNGVNLTINRGDFISLIGPSGCGKSTMLRILAGLDSPTEGAVYIDDELITKPNYDRGLVCLLDTAVTEPYASEYCCVSFVSDELAEKHPKIAAAFTDAVLKGSAWVAAHPEETAALQIEKEYVSGDAASNAAILKSYKYIPSVQGGYDALVNVSRDLKDIGLLKPETDVNALVERSFKFFDGLPDSYSVNGDTFTPVGKTTKTAHADCCG